MLLLLLLLLLMDSLMMLVGASLLNTNDALLLGTNTVLAGVTITALKVIVAPTSSILVKVVSMKLAKTAVMCTTTRHTKPGKVELLDELPNLALIRVLAKKSALHVLVLDINQGVPKPLLRGREGGKRTGGGRVGIKNGLCSG